MWRDNFDIMPGGSNKWNIGSVINFDWLWTTSVSFDEAAGGLDSINLYWNQASFPMEVYGIGAIRYAD